MSRINVLNAIDDGGVKRFINALQQCSQPYIHTRNEGHLQQSTEQNKSQINYKEHDNLLASQNSKHEQVVSDIKLKVGP